MSLTKTVTFVAKKGSEEALKALLSMMVAPSQAEKGCLFYSISQYQTKPDTFLVLESWENEEALKAHQHSAHYAHYKAHYEPFCASKHSEDLELL